MVRYSKPVSLQLIKIVDRSIINERWKPGVVDYACEHVFSRLAEEVLSLPNNVSWSYGEFQNCVICYRCDRLSPAAKDGSRSMRTPIDGPRDSMEGWNRKMTPKEELKNQKAIAKRIRAGKKMSKHFLDGQEVLEESLTRFK